MYTYTYVIYTYYTHIRSMFIWVDLYFTFAHTSTPKTSQKGIHKTNSLFFRYFDLEICRLGCIYVGCRWLSWLSNHVESHGTSAECVVMFPWYICKYVFTYLYIFWKFTYMLHESIYDVYIYNIFICNNLCNIYITFIVYIKKDNTYINIICFILLDHFYNLYHR